MAVASTTALQELATRVAGVEEQLGRLSQALSALDQRVTQGVQGHTAVHDAQIQQKQEIDQLRADCAANYNWTQQELTTIRQMRVPSSQGQLFDLKLMTPPQFGDSNLKFKDWSYKLMNYMGAKNRNLKVAMDQAARHPDPIKDTDITSFGTTSDADDFLDSVLCAITLGEALEVVKGSDLQLGLEKWRQLVKRFDPTTNYTRFSDVRNLMTVSRVDMNLLPARIQQWENDELTMIKRGGSKLPEEHRMMALFQMCPEDVQKEIEWRADHYDTYAKIKERVLNLAQTRTSGTVPMHIGNFQEPLPEDAPEELCDPVTGELYALSGPPGQRKYAKEAEGQGQGQGQGAGHARMLSLRPRGPRSRRVQGVGSRRRRTPPRVPSEQHRSRGRGRGPSGRPAGTGAQQLRAPLRPWGLRLR